MKEYLLEFDQNTNCLKINGKLVLSLTLTTGEDIAFRSDDKVTLKGTSVPDGTVTEREFESPVVNVVNVKGNKNIAIGGVIQGANVTIGDTVIQSHQSVGDNVLGNKIVTHVTHVSTGNFS